LWENANLENPLQYRRNPNFIYREIVDEAILVPIHQDVVDMDCIYTLNDLGAFIWGLLEQPQTRDALIAAVLEAYDADPEVVTADLGLFLDEMATVGAIEEM
jgi:hypothetical protein